MISQLNVASSMRMLTRLLLALIAAISSCHLLASDPVLVLAVLVWLRRRIPLLRPDRFMEIGWVVLLPAAVLQDLVVSLVVVWKG